MFSITIGVGDYYVTREGLVALAIHALDVDSTAQEKPKHGNVIGCISWYPRSLSLPNAHQGIAIVPNLDFITLDLF